MKKNLLLVLFILLVLNIGNAFGQEAHSLFFDKKGCVDIPEIAELTGTAARTVEAWIKFPSDEAVLDWWQPVIIEWGKNNAGEKWCFRLDHYRLRVEHAGGYAIATTTLNDDKWHHVAVTAAESSNIADVKFYIDGMQDATSSSGGGTPAINTASGPIAIGRSVADDQTDRIFTGYIDEVRLWKKELSALDILDIMDKEVCPGDQPDLVAYYKFNDGEGTTAKDETGNFDGTLGTGNKSDALPVWADGYAVTTKSCGQKVQGKALNFARNSCVDIPEIPELIGTAARTVEAWIRVPTSNLDWWQPVIIEWGVNDKGTKFDFRLDYYKLRIEHGGGYATATTALNDSLWHHVAVSLPENSLMADAKFYIDGVEDPISASGGTVVANTASGDFSIGRAIADDQAVRYWNGDMDEVRLWNKALTAQEINDNMNNELCPSDNPNLMAYYKFDDGEGVIAKDETGNNDGILASGKDDDGIPSWVDGIELTEANCGGELTQGSGLYFDRNSCVDIPEITDLIGTAARTIEAWVRVPTSNLDWWQPVIIEWGVNDKGTKFDFRLDYYKLRIEHGGGYTTATTALNDSVWHHVAVSLPENSLLSTAKFYIDGVEDPISASGGTIVANTASGDFSIGRAIADDQAVRYWKGDMDEVRLWKKALTSEEINTIKDSEVCVGDNPDLVAYYKFNDGEGVIAKDETGKNDGVLASGKDDDGLPSWVDGVSVYAAECEPTDIFSNVVRNIVKLYPNPAYSYVQLDADKPVERVIFYNLVGHQVKNIEGFSIDRIDISDLKTGIYLVQVIADQKDVHTLKLIKK